MPCTPGVDVQPVANAFEVTPHEHGYNSSAQLGYDLEELEMTSPPSHASVQTLRPLAPHHPWAEAATRTIGTAAQPRSQRRSVHDCDVPGCSATFRRPAEFRRHKRTVHMRHEAQEFECIVKSCNYTYPRLDKVREHMKRMHGICLRVEKP
ncbi:hypothetical protein DPSP01_009986 [Paraphaeosphaeria sporulosa]